MKNNNNKKSQSIKDNPNKKSWLIIITFFAFSIFVTGLYLYFINNYTNVEYSKKTIPSSLESEIIRLESLVDDK